MIHSLTVWTKYRQAQLTSTSPHSRTCLGHSEATVRASSLFGRSKGYQKLCGQRMYRIQIALTFTLWFVRIVVALQTTKASRRRTYNSRPKFRFWEVQNSVPLLRLLCVFEIGSGISRQVFWRGYLAREDVELSWKTRQFPQLLFQWWNVDPWAVDCLVNLREYCGHSADPCVSRPQVSLCIWVRLPSVTKTGHRSGFGLPIDRLNVLQGKC